MTGSVVKEDVLEQLVDDYLMHQGYLTRHNLRFAPSAEHADYDRRKDAVSSDIDVIGYNPKLHGTDRVWVVSCKAWQQGFDPAAKVAQIRKSKIVSGRDAWKGFRELCKPKWSEAFRQTVEKATGETKFTYVTVVTRLLNERRRDEWEQNAEFRQALGRNPIRILTLAEMLDTLWSDLTTTPAASDIGRALQLIKAAGWTAPATPAKPNRQRQLMRLPEPIA